MELATKEILKDNKAKEEIMNKYNRFCTNKKGYYEGCYYETSEGLKAWKEVITCI